MQKMFALVIIAFSLAFAGCASQQRVPQSERKYQEVLDMPGIKSNELYEKTLQSLAKMFNSSKEVIQYQNQEEGQIIGNGNVAVMYTIIPVTTWFTITIDIKDEKMRITFTDMYMDQTVGSVHSKDPITLQGQMDSFTEEAKRMVLSLKENIQTKKEDW